VTTDQLDPTASAEYWSVLRESAKQLVGRNWGLREALTLMDQDVPLWSAKLWQAACDSDWNNLLVPASSGGGGGTVGDLCVLSETIGTSVAPIPLAASAAANWYLGCPESARTTLLVNEQPILVNQTTGPYTATCSWPFIPYGMIASRLLVPVLISGDLRIVIVDAMSSGVTRMPIEPLDRSPSAAIELRDVSVEPASAVDETLPRLISGRWEGAVNRLRLGIASELTGVAAAANNDAVEYARERITFGRPIGFNQAIKHRLVDDRCNIEISRALIARAAVDLENGAGDSAASVALACFWAMDALRAVPESAIQVFGGIGYTWEHHAHLYLRRAAVLAALLGPMARDRDVAAAWLARRLPG
jgi:alkylation response protein AidB-like acyl-CoA dehydrogenase